MLPRVAIADGCAGISPPVHAAPLPAPNRLLSERLLLGPAIECGNVRNWVVLRRSAFGMQIGGSRHSIELAGMTAMRPFADDFRLSRCFLECSTANLEAVAMWSW
jgi:hypothetical protein